MTCNFSKMSLPGTLPHGVDGRHQDGSCLAAFICPLALLVPSYDPNRPHWDVLGGQMTSDTPRTKQTRIAYRQTWCFRLFLGLPGKIIRKTYPCSKIVGPAQILRSHSCCGLQRQTSPYSRLKKECEIKTLPLFRRMKNWEGKRMWPPTGRKNSKQQSVDV